MALSAVRRRRGKFKISLNHLTKERALLNVIPVSHKKRGSRQAVGLKALKNSSVGAGEGLTQKSVKHGGVIDERFRPLSTLPSTCMLTANDEMVQQVLRIV